MTEILRRVPLLALVLAASLTVGAPARADDGADARKFIAATADQAIAIVDNTSYTDAQRVDAFTKLFVVSFDLPEIGKFVLGRHWKSATPAQQQEFVKLFQDLTVLTWSGRFKGYRGVRLEVQGAAQDQDAWVVDSRIVRSQGDPLPLQWRVHKTPDGWRIVDIGVEGVSMALTQRQDFASAMQESGGTVDSLNTALRAKVAQLRAGN